MKQKKNPKRKVLLALAALRVPPIVVLQLLSSCICFAYTFRDKPIQIKCENGKEVYRSFQKIRKYESSAICVFATEGFNNFDDLDPVPLKSVHHVALKTRNITKSLQFYGLFGLEVVCKFRAGPARAAWLEFNRVNNESALTRIEIIEVPSYMLPEETEMTQSRAPDLMKRQNILGYNHLALDVTPVIKSESNNISSLLDWIDALNAKSAKAFGKTVRIALPPREQMIGQSIFEIAFLYDADGCLIELLYLKDFLQQQVNSGWEPWDGKVWER